MCKPIFPKLLSGVTFIAGFALLIFAGRHVFATPNATGGADNHTVDWASKRVVSFENSAALLLEGAPEDAFRLDRNEAGAKLAAGANANAVLSLDLITDGGAGNRRDDGVTSGTVSGRGATIALEVFATGVRTSLRGMIIKFDFDASLVSFVKAENSAFGLSVRAGSVGTNFAGTSLVTLAPSGFLARAEFETVANVTGTAFTIGIESVTLAESSTSSDEITTASEIGFNATRSPDFDGDGTVGFPDFLAFAGSFGTSQGDARYEARYDLDGNGSVGFSDFLIFAGAFGSQVPPSGGGGTTPPPSGFAPANQQAFNSLAVGNRVRAQGFFVDIVSAGRFTEGLNRHEGRYTYTNTGANSGQFTQVYDDTELFGGRCESRLTFTSATTGTGYTTCDSGFEGNTGTWRITELATPVFVRASSDTLHFGILGTWRAGQTRAYDLQLRKKTPQGRWNDVCVTYSNRSDDTITAYAGPWIYSPDLEPNTTYEFRYRYRNSSSCDTGSPEPWSPIAEGTTADGATGGGGGGNGTPGSLGRCTVGMVVRPNQSCTVSGGALRNIGGGCVNYTPFGSGRICSAGFNLNGLQGTREGDNFRITAVP